MTPAFVLLLGLVRALAVAELTSVSGPCSFSRDRSLLCVGGRVTQLPSALPRNTSHLVIKQTNLRELLQGAFRGLNELSKVWMVENVVLKKIGASAFADLPKLTEIIITKSKDLAVISKKAFKGLPKLQYLEISNTGLTVVPDFSQIFSSAPRFVLDLQDNIHIERIPRNAFRGLCTDSIEEVRLARNGLREVESHAFNGTRLDKLSLMGNPQLSHIHGNAFAGAVGPVSLFISHTAVSSLPESILWGIQVLSAESVFTLKELPSPDHFPLLWEASLTYPSHCCAFQNMPRNRSRMNPLCQNLTIKDEPHFHGAFCRNSTEVLCSPAPDVFSPCEDIMEGTALQVLIWLVSTLTLLGNAAVLLVLLGSQSKLTVPRFLMCHLSFADLCMGVYLIVIATVDLRTRGKYYNHAIDWQTGFGCSAAGFFTVFASELSVFTLTAITLERWHTITYALRLDRKLRLQHACVIMAVGWVFSSVAAVMPALGISSYSKVSICLPMDVETAQSQVYVVFLLLLNVLAFVCVCSCYLGIYLTVHNSSSTPARSDARVAQRMAVLVFTDFLCMAPISFFAISAALKLPLITVSHSKLLLVLFYPINSCANPFLYAFCTRNFRQDFFLLAARFGLCTTRAQIYRTESSSIQQPAWIPSSRTSQGTLYSLVTISHGH
ncbi:follicle-stimulating hormone receptor [Hypomesus transpacificus]|uniref:follicle-stimulating hormone receptor n=1 Tax=Hypomesus transpacificus TaxID=137520 RepID=UPI001F076465|nr:follicle-stimulating hormone receptor [Hypomesus transpacificus]